MEKFGVFGSISKNMMKWFVEPDQKMNCSHCRGTQYVLACWLENMLEKQGIHMSDLLTDIPREIFKMIPLDHIFYCHCNIRIVIFKNSQAQACKECDGTTWKFTEIAERAGYRGWASRLTTDDVKALPCSYFKRCQCNAEEEPPKLSNRAEDLNNFFSLLRLNPSKFGLDILNCSLSL